MGRRDEHMVWCALELENTELWEPTESSRRVEGRWQLELTAFTGRIPTLPTRAWLTDIPKQLPPPGYRQDGQINGKLAKRVHV